MARTTKIQRFDGEAFTGHILRTMKERRTTHKALAEETGLAMGLVKKMRRDGRRPTADAFLALCHWANADPMRFHVLPGAQVKPPAIPAGPFDGLIR